MDTFLKFNIIFIIIGIFLLITINEILPTENVFYGQSKIKTTTVGYDGRNININIIIDWYVHYKYKYFAPIRKKKIETIISNQIKNSIFSCFNDEDMGFIIENHLRITNLIFSFHNNKKGLKYETHPNMIFSYEHITFDEYLSIKNQIKIKNIQKTNKKYKL